MSSALAVLALAAGCMHTPPHPAIVEPATVRLSEGHAVPDIEGRTCFWEEEGLWLRERRILGAEAPEGHDRCTDLTDHWRTLDLLGQDGRFVSLFVADDQGGEDCGTWNVESGLRATLEEYDVKLADKRIKRAERLRVRRAIPGRFSPDSFFVRGGHVVFCLFDPTGVRRDLEVR